MFEQERQDTTPVPTRPYTCVVFFADVEVPSKWQETLKCCQCKGRLTSFLLAFISDTIQPFLRGDQEYVTSGALDKPGGG